MNNADAAIARGEHVYLRRLSTQDNRLLRRVFADPDVMASSTTGPMSYKEIKDYILYQLDSYRDRTYGTWAIARTADDDFIGCCGVGTRTVDGTEYYEIGYRLVKRHWGKGYATEAAQLAIEYVRALGIPQLMAMIEPDHPASLRIAEKLGMAYAFRTRYDGVLVNIYLLELENNK